MRSPRKVGFLPVQEFPQKLDGFRGVSTLKTVGQRGVSKLKTVEQRGVSKLKTVARPGGADWDIGVRTSRAKSAAARGDVSKTKRFLAREEGCERA